jgi:uncharacterized protein (DUF2384 family)
MREQIETFVAAEKVFDSPDLADRWMARPNRRLGGRKPADLAKTRAGAASVLAVLARLAETRRRDPAGDLGR